MSVGVVVVFPCVCVEGLDQSHMLCCHVLSAGNPMPATFRQPHAGNPTQLATLCQAPVAGIQKSSSTAQSKHCETKKNKQQAPPATTGAVKRLPLPRCQEEDAFATAVATAATTASRGTSCLRDQATTTGGPQVTTQGIDDAYLGDANEVYGNLRYV